MMTRLDRRSFLGALTGAGILVAPTARAQGTRRVRTIGFLGPPPSASGFVQAFQQGLRELGYVDGGNVKVAYRHTDVALQGDVEQLSRLADELVRLEPDVLVVSVVEAALAAKRATTSIPIVMVNVADPVGAGLVASLARPGGNITGLSRQGPDLVGKQFQILKEALPRTARVGVLVNPTEPLHALVGKLAQAAAASLDMEATVLEPHAPAELEGAFAALRADRVGAVLVGGGGSYYLSRAVIAELALRGRLPSMFQNRESAEAGGLMSYAANTVANYRRAAFFVDRIFHGAKPAELPIEQPTKFELIVNLKTAKALGVSIPRSVLLRADVVIQ
jgi:putative tryptophan/tyrosine transport system substrate-binding protein